MPENLYKQTSSLQNTTPLREPIDNTLRCRYEMKYLISKSKAQAIAQFVESHIPLDRYCKLSPTGDYPIVSLYLDSHNLQLCRESLEGHKNRFKLRIRSYTDTPGYPCFFEIKRRMNTVITKDRSRVKNQNIADLLAGVSLPDHDYRTDLKMLEQFHLYKTSINASPMIKIRYIRKAYEGNADNRVRITFDNQLYFNASGEPDVLIAGPGWQRYPLEGVVLEIKFTGCYPAWLTRMIKCFNLQQQSFSKYARSIEKACSFGFCAPKIPMRLH